MPYHWDRKTDGIEGCEGFLIAAGKPRSRLQMISILRFRIDTSDTIHPELRKAFEIFPKMHPSQ